MESGNVTSTFSDHLPQFIFLPDFFSKIQVTKSYILRRDWKNLKALNLYLIYLIPFKKLNKKELKFLTKPWTMQSLQNSIKKKNNIYAQNL